MKTYYVDANIFLRFLLNDHESFSRQARRYLEKAQRGEVRLVLTTEIILEINYVLRSVYSLARQETAKKLQVIVRTSYVDVLERDLLVEVLDKYERINVDLADLILYEKAQMAEAGVLSFDKADMKKIQAQAVKKEM